MLIMPIFASFIYKIGFDLFVTVMLITLLVLEKVLVRLSTMYLLSLFVCRRERMSSHPVGVLPLLNSSCFIDSGLRTEEQQISCVNTELKIQKVAVAGVILLTLLYGKSTIPDRTKVSDEFGREKYALIEDSNGNVPTGRNYKRGMMYGLGIGIVGVGVVKLTRAVRMAEWRANVAATQAAQQNPIGAQYIVNRTSAEAATRANYVHRPRQPY
jgi:hypothetical protein